MAWRRAWHFDGTVRGALLACLALVASVGFALLPATARAGSHHSMSTAAGPLTGGITYGGTTATSAVQDPRPDDWYFF